MDSDPRKGATRKRCEHRPTSQHSRTRHNKKKQKTNASPCYVGNVEAVYFSLFNWSSHSKEWCFSTLDLLWEKSREHSHWATSSSFTLLFLFGPVYECSRCIHKMIRPKTGWESIATRLLLTGLWPIIIGCSEWPRFPLSFIFCFIGPVFISLWHYKFLRLAQ